jgi:hypothetical protein
MRYNIRHGMQKGFQKDGLREEQLRQVSAPRAELIGSAPTEPEAFLLCKYTAINALQTYLICSQDEPRAWVWARQGGSWPQRATELVGREGKIAVGGLGIELTMAAIFRGIPGAPTVE